MNMKRQVLASLKTRPLSALAVAHAYRLALALRASASLCFKFRYAYIASDARLIGISRIQIGKCAAVGSGTLLNVNDRATPGVALSIGDNTFIGPRNFLSVGRSIIIREYCLTTVNCAFVGSVHRYDDPTRAYTTTGTTLDADIYVGANCFFGTGAQVIGCVRIGHGCVIGASAVIRSDVPPFSLVVGNPARVIKRFDFALKKWVEWPCDNLADGPSEEEYVEHLREQHGYVVQPISVAASSFGNIV